MIDAREKKILSNLHSTANTVVVIRHHHGDLDDVASTHLRANGYTIEDRYPFEGDDLADIMGTFDPARKHPTDQQNKRNIAGTVVHGGAQNVTSLDKHAGLPDEIRWIEKCLTDELPVVGICLGAQLLAHTLGAAVRPHRDKLCEFGYYPVYPTAHAISWMKRPMHMVQAHFEHFDIPQSSVLLATGERFENQAFRYGSNAFGLQFHPEVSSSMFSEWQSSDWAKQFYATAGAQPKAQQTSANALHNAAQTDWFRNFLTGLFPPLGTGTLTGSSSDQ